MPTDQPSDQPNVLFVMTDQQRFDTIAALGHSHVSTPNHDRLVERGVSFTNAYSPAPVCVPARHTVRTGCDPITTGYLGNDNDSSAAYLEDRCGPFLARRMGELGYRTFGVGKFHERPVGLDLGYDSRVTGDDYAADYDVDKAVDTGRTAAMNMLPQSCPLPPEKRKMSWIADRAVERIRGEGDGGDERDGGGDGEGDDDAPFFGLVSFSKPHPGWNPSPPFDELYDPDTLPDAIREDRELDHRDEKIPAQNYHFWKSRADDTAAETIRAARAHYYGLVTQLDRELGRVLDAVEARDDAENTVICFFSDHGEMLGDHHGWGKTSFFEASARVPFLLSWPAELPAGERCEDLVSLTDLFGIATTAAGDQELRNGVDVLGSLTGDAEPRERLFGYHETPRKTDAFSILPNFTLMVREGDWKYVYAANGGREQLFDVAANPRETEDRLDDRPEVAARLRRAAVKRLQAQGGDEYLDNDSLREHPYRRIEMGRYNPDTYPTRPAEALESGEE